MIGAGGLTKVVRGFQMFFPGKKESPKREYKDKFPKKLPTIEDVKKEYGAVVWCKFSKCASNQEVKNLQILLINLAKPFMSLVTIFIKESILSSERFQ